jgi:hypothetical protein
MLPSQETPLIGFGHPWLVIRPPDGTAPMTLAGVFWDFDCRRDCGGN